MDDASAAASQGEAVEDNPSKIGVLLLHGLTGTPSEMKVLTKAVKKMGLHAEIPTIAGHGAGHKELLATTWQDWYESVETVLKDMSERYEQVYVVGLSMGGLLALLLAHRHPKLVSGLVLLSMDLAIPGSSITPLRHLLPYAFKMPSFIRNSLYWTESHPYGLKDARLQKMITKSIQAAKKGQTDQFGLFRTYVGSLYQMTFLIDETLTQTPHVTTPTLIIHSLEDTMLTPANATHIYSLLSSPKKNLTLINGCDHVMTVDLRKDEVARLTCNFIQSTMEEQWQKISISGAV